MQKQDSASSIVTRKYHLNAKDYFSMNMVFSIFFVSDCCFVGIISMSNKESFLQVQNHTSSEASRSDYYSIKSTKGNITRTELMLSNQKQDSVRVKSLPPLKKMGLVPAGDSFCRKRLWFCVCDGCFFAPSKISKFILSNRK